MAEQLSPYECGKKAAIEGKPGHGHVRPNRDGVVARCGGPAMCSFCRGERDVIEGRKKWTGPTIETTLALPPVMIGVQEPTAGEHEERRRQAYGLPPWTEGEPLVPSAAIELFRTYVTAARDGVSRPINWGFVSDLEARVMTQFRGMRALDLIRALADEAAAMISGDRT